MTLYVIIIRYKIANPSNTLEEVDSDQEIAQLKQDEEIDFQQRGKTIGSYIVNTSH